MDNPILIHAQQIEGTAFGDPRLVKRGRHCMQLSCQHQSVNIRQISRNRAEQVGYYRFLDSGKRDSIGISAEPIGSLPTAT